MTEICAALDLELYVGPPRDRPQIRRSERSPSSTRFPIQATRTARRPVTDRGIATVIAVLADEHEEMDVMFGEGPLTCFWHFVPEFRESGDWRELSPGSAGAWLRTADGRTAERCICNWESGALTKDSKPAPV